MKRHTVFFWMGVGAAALCVPAAVTMPVAIVYNESDSLPRGWYRVGRTGDADSLRVGSIVLARLPADAALLAAQRGYLPSSVPVLKRIAAVAPQSVCVWDRIVAIDGAMLATALERDGLHRPLPVWSQCRPLVANELFLLSNTNPASFDSRYFGPIIASNVLGIARPLWTWSKP